jgi:hypothetical protein
MRRALRSDVRAAALGVLFAAAVAAAQVGRPSGVRLIQIRLEGHVGAPDPKHRAAGDLTFRWDDTRVRFQAARVVVTRGERLGADFLAEIAPYRSILLLQGDEAPLDRIRTAKPSDRLSIIGYHRTGSRTFAVSAVDVRPAH